MTQFKNSIAIVGMACVYPGARTPDELWENVMAQRRAFRRLPAERLRIEDYFSSDKSAPDATYASDAAVIEGYEFDRLAYQVVGTTYRAADLAHWMALDVASKALEDAGFGKTKTLPRELTGVLIGNTLTGEISRANAMRLRWPYVRRTLEAALAKENWNPEQREKFLSELENNYKAPFPPIGEESLAGGLSNTIAGRICNHFDLKGGGYTVDGACASSLLAVANACSALVAGDLEVAIAGGVDLSLDPFEIIGFAKTGALAPDGMHVFDKRSAGFLPGEGCGMAVLMRYEEAVAKGLRVYSIIRGWGVSSDGKGGITRPEAEGQLEALRRAYRKAGFGAETVAYCEGHGTGTAVGDTTELEVLSRARSESGKPFSPAALGSIKATIGHTKAAAGIAGLIKATLALHKQILPPTTGCEQPNEKIHEQGDALRILKTPEVWPSNLPLRASVSAMGFGGINAHLVLENPTVERKQSFTNTELQQGRSPQDAEIFLFRAETSIDLIAHLDRIHSFARRISLSEMTDLSAALQNNLGSGNYRAAFVASKPAELFEQLSSAMNLLNERKAELVDVAKGIFLGASDQEPEIGFMFPGQGSPMNLDGGIWKRRFETVRELYATSLLPEVTVNGCTKVMQPAVVTASLAALRVLNRLGLHGRAAIGHSLGEITALHWSGVMDEEALLRVVRVRGTAMAELGEASGAMLAVAAPWRVVQGMIQDKAVRIVGYNSPRQTVVGGNSEAIKRLASVIKARGFSCSLLPVSHAFHTPAVATAVPALSAQLKLETLFHPNGKVFSTVTGDSLSRTEDIRELLCNQVTLPVKFMDAFEKFSQAKDLLIEIGPGTVLGNLATEMTSKTVISLDAGGASLKGMLKAAGAAFALGSRLNTAVLFEDRLTRPFALDWQPRFISNPCERAPISERGVIVQSIPAKAAPETTLPIPTTLEPVEIVRQVIAERTELPLASILDSSRMLGDLHLNSITVGQIVAEAARKYGMPCITNLTDFANATVLEIAQAIVELKAITGNEVVSESGNIPAGIDNWTRCFATVWRETKSVKRQASIKGKPDQTSEWRMFGFSNEEFTNQLSAALRHMVGESGAVLYIPRNPDKGVVPSFLAAANSIAELKGDRKFIVVQHGWGGSGFAKTLHLENPSVATLVVNMANLCPEAAGWIAHEAASVREFSEVKFDDTGIRFEPKLKHFEPSKNEIGSATKLDSHDVMLVTGGGKGIVAECALAYAIKSGAKLALMGRSNPELDQELAANLKRLHESQINFKYFQADVCDPQSVVQAITEVRSSLGEVTAVLHGAGVNTPQLIGSLDESLFAKTIAPKVDGLKNVLNALDGNKLKLLLTFGSIIAQTGLPGAAHYASANEWLSALTSEYQERSPHCRCLSLEWSVWSGAGMGEKLGRIETLARQGIQAIPLETGVSKFCELIDQGNEAGSLIVTGRFGNPPTLKFEETELPLHRFLEHTKLFYPGVELIVEAELSIKSDPYLLDHQVQKQCVLPAVLGLEAMTQVAAVLQNSKALPVIEGANFLRPVIVPETGSTRIRIVGLRTGDGLVEVGIRSSETDFQMDHFRAVFKFGVAKNTSAASLVEKTLATSKIELGPGRDLYGSILFHGPRFQKLNGYHKLEAKACVAAINPDETTSWFGPYTPGKLLLGNPGARDAAIHAIQACIPHQRILPTGIDRLTIRQLNPGEHLVYAKERTHEGNHFVYDVTVTDLAGNLLEQYEGLHLQAVEELPIKESIPSALAAVYLERGLTALAPEARIRLVLEPGGRELGQASTDQLIQKALGEVINISRTPAGRPLSADGRGVSASHSSGYSLAVSALKQISCDLESVTARSEVQWKGLLGEERFLLAKRIHENQHASFDAAATRVWTVIECLKKLGRAANSPLVLESAFKQGWITFRSGKCMIHTAALILLGAKTPMIVAVADWQALQPAVKTPITQPASLSMA